MPRLRGADVDTAAFMRGLEQALSNLNITTTRELHAVGLRIQNQARRYAPVDTGRLRSSIQSTPGRDARGPFVEVGTRVHYAPHVEFGTAPHRIEPTRPHGLLAGRRFGPVRGGVNHPGTQARPFMRSALATVAGFDPRQVRP